MTYFLEKASSPIMVFGSSHANRHYIPDVIEKILGKSCYNAGTQGQYILFHSAIQKIVLQRTRPELIILNLDARWFNESKQAYDRLSDLHPYYWEHRNTLKPILSKRSKIIDLQLLFNSYRTNSTIVHALKYFLAPQPDYKGYLPLHGQMSPPTIPVEEYRPEHKPIDEYFTQSFHSFIANAKNKNIDLIFTISPCLYKTDYQKDQSMRMMLKIAKKERIPVLDYSQDPHFQYQYHLFYDNTHLNDEGAHIFSTLIADAVKKIFPRYQRQSLFNKSS